MTLSIIIPGGAFTNYVAKLLPVPSGLLGLFRTNNDATTAKKNIIPTGSQLATIVGEPTYASTFITTGVSIGAVDTGIAVPAEYTMIAVAKTRKLITASVAGNVVSGGSQVNSGTGIVFNGGALYSWRSKSATVWTSFDSVNIPMTAGVEGEFAFFSGSANAAGNLSAYYGRANVLTTISQAFGTSHTPATRNALAGNYGTNSYTGNSEIAMYGLWNRKLTELEMAEVYAWCQAEMLALGITTL